MLLNQDKLGFVEEVFRYSNLPENKKIKLYDYFLRWLETTDYNLDFSEEGLYRYASNLIQKAEERGLKRGDALKRSIFVGSLDNFNLLAHTLASAYYENRNLAEYDGNEDLLADNGGLSLEEAFHIIEPELDSLDAKILNQLLNYNGSKQTKLKISPEELLNSIPKIHKKLEILAKEYEKDGRLIIPRRPIVHVEFDPSFLIKFGQRRYEGSPLAFFKEHVDVYRRMSRTELFNFDCGLYCSLIKHKQLNEAIPEKKYDTYRGYESPLDYFRAHPEKYKGITRTKLRNYDSGLSSSLINYKQLNEAIPKKIQKLSQAQIDEIIVAYPVYRGNITETSRHIPYSKSTIRKYWKAAGLEIREPGGQAEEGIKEIVASHEIFKGNSQRAARYFYCSPTTVIGYWRANGLEPLRKGGTHLSEEEIKKIIDSYPIYKDNIMQAERNLNHDSATIRKYWKQAGLEPTGIQGRSLPNEKVNEIIAAYKTFNGNASVATTSFPCCRRTISRYWKKHFS